MCWRDDVATTRHCSVCGQEYYGDLGHRGCPGRKKPTKIEGTPKTPEKKMTKNGFVPTDEVPF